MTHRPAGTQTRVGMDSAFFLEVLRVSPVLAGTSPGGGSLPPGGREGAITSPESRASGGWQQGSEGSLTRMGCAGPKGLCRLKATAGSSAHQKPRRHTVERALPGFPFQLCASPRRWASAGGPKGLCPLGSRRITRGPLWPTLGVKKRVRTSNLTRTRQPAAKGAPALSSCVPQPALTCCAWGCGLWMKAAAGFLSHGHQ